jgi:hypothetical protein
LAAIHHTGEVEVQNVVRVPDTAESVEEWLKGTPGELIEAGATEVKP